jgi:hypothetical protein
VAKERQLVDANQITDFGGVEGDLASLDNETGFRHDYTYVPGFSDLRYELDVAKGEVHRHERRASELPILPVNMRWFRTVLGKGSDPDQMRAYAALNQGYRPANKTDVGQQWLTKLPPGAKYAPDGSIQSAGGDLALYVIDQQGAARNAYRKKKATEEMVDGMEMKAGGLGHIAQQHKGADPTVVKQIGAEVTK